MPCSFFCYSFVLFYCCFVYFYATLPQVNATLDVRGKNKAITSMFYDHLSLFKYSKKEGHFI